jgi:ferredoxin
MNRIYFFSGTGNSLHAAKLIAERLGECELVAVRKGSDTKIPAGLECVGFVFPVYYWGLPVMVAEFLKAAEFPSQGDTYYFAVATMGGITGNSLPQAKKLLAAHGVRLDYGASVRSFGNAVFAYDMKPDVAGITAKSDKRLQAVIPDIVGKKAKRVGGGFKFVDRLYHQTMDNAHTFDRKFSVSDDCVSCGICAAVCPAHNITLDGKPQFSHQCEMCAACIQHCPKRAMNHGDKTQTRRRYAHPQISHAEIAEYYIQGE